VLFSCYHHLYPYCIYVFVACFTGKLSDSYYVTYIVQNREVNLQCSAYIHADELFFLLWMTIHCQSKINSSFFMDRVGSMLYKWDFNHPLIIKNKITIQHPFTIYIKYIQCSVFPNAVNILLSHFLYLHFNGYIVNGCWIVILFLMIKGWLFCDTLTIIGMANDKIYIVYV
jgi:hypothetical protein